MDNLSLVLLAAGSSSRFEFVTKKQWLWCDDKPLWKFVADNFKESGYFDNIVIVSSKTDIDYMKNFTDEYIFVEGGNTRGESLKNGLNFVDTDYVLVSDVARVCIGKSLIERLLDKKEDYDVVVPYLNSVDTVVYKNETINRDEIKLIQTPQLSKTSVLKKALEISTDFTDDSSAVVAYGGSRGFVQGEKSAVKLTYKDDLKLLECLTPPCDITLSGNGFDVHKFDMSKDFLYLCGEKIECGYGFEAHSDGDVAIHALIDAILGAIGFGDIGELFPDTDETYKDMDSKILLKNVLDKVVSFGYELVNVDITVIAQQPRLKDYKPSFRKNLAKLLNLDMQRVNIKATTTEKLGFTGRKEGVAVMANANLKYFDWSKKL